MAFFGGKYTASGGVLKSFRDFLCWGGGKVVFLGWLPGGGCLP
jgi:hypothetical protein